MPRLQRALPEAISANVALEYLRTQLPAIDSAVEGVSGPASSFKTLASAASLLNAKGPDIIRAAAVYVDRTSASLAVTAVDLLAEKEPELFVNVIEAFTTANGRGGKLKAPGFFIAQFMNTQQTFNAGFAGKRIKLPKGFTHENGSFATNGSQLIAIGHTRLFEDVLDQAFSNAWRGLTPSYEQQPALLEMTNQRASQWNQRYTALKNGS